MYMNLKHNKHKRISFNTTTMASLGFIGSPKILGPFLNLAPPQKNLIFCPGPLQLYRYEIFRSPLKLGEASTMSSFTCYHELC